MKKSTLILTAMSMLSFAAGAQGFYARLGLGYAVPQAGQTIDGTSTPYNGSQNFNSAAQTQTYNIKGASFSAGMRGDLGLGYMISKHIGVQLDAGLGLSGRKYTCDLNNVYVGGVLSKVSIIQQAKSPTFLMPSLVLNTGGDKLSGYARFGIALPLNTKITLDQVVQNAPGTGAITVDDFTFDVKSSFALGFTAAAGLQYKLSDRMSLWGELSLLSMSVYIKEAHLTTVTENGQNVPLQYVNGNQTVTYSKTAVVDSNGAVQPAYAQPFSHIGVNVGVSFHFGGRSNGGRSRMADPADDNSRNKPYRRR